MGLTLDKSTGRALGDYQMFNIQNIDHDEIVFKASFIILSDIVCSGKIIANFDLVVLGYIEAKSIEIKGKLVCVGSIKAEKVIAKEIAASTINAAEVDAIDGIMAQEIDANIIKSEGVILVGKNITVEKAIDTRESIICGEGLYAYGSVKAKTIMAVDNIDIPDEPIKGMFNQIQSEPQIKTFETSEVSETVDGKYKDWKANIIKEIEMLIMAKDISKLEQYLKKNYDCEFMDNYAFAVDILNDLRTIPQKNRMNDLVLFLDLHKIICETPIMKHFDILVDNYRFYNEAFINAVKNNLFETTVVCEFASYSDFIQAITIIQKHGNRIDKQIFFHIIDKVYNSLGVKGTFLNSVFQRRGWKIND